MPIKGVLYILQISRTVDSPSDAIKCHNCASGVMVIVVGNGHGDTSSKPERDW